MAIWCHHCKGSGIDPDLRSRYTSGGKDNRDCEKCLGEGRIIPEVTMDLHDQCMNAVGRYVHFKGTNGNEYDKVNHGKPVEGFGYCSAYHDSHGLCIEVQLDCDECICVDPTEITIDNTIERDNPTKSPPNT
jgi:hypothetical protein